MIADLLSPNRWNWLIANVKNFNLNVTEVLVSDFKNAFSPEFPTSPTGSYADESSEFLSHEKVNGLTVFKMDLE